MTKQTLSSSKTSGTFVFMRAFAVAKRDVKSFLVSPSSYVVLTSGLVLASYFFFHFLATYNAAVSRAMSNPGVAGELGLSLNAQVIEPYFQTLSALFVFIVPLFAMRSFSEEKERGTLELLMSSPATSAELVIGKFLGLTAVFSSFCMLCFMLPLSVWFALSFELLPAVGAAFGVTIFGLSLCALGILASILSGRQYIACSVSLIGFLLLYSLHAPAEYVSEATAQVLYALSPGYYLRDCVKGVLSSAAILYFGSLISLGLIASTVSFDYTARR